MLGIRLATGRPRTGTYARATGHRSRREGAWAGRCSREKVRGKQTSTKVFCQASKPQFATSGRSRTLSGRSRRRGRRGKEGMAWTARLLGMGLSRKLWRCFYSSQTGHISLKLYFVFALFFQPGTASISRSWSLVSAVPCLTTKTALKRDPTIRWDSAAYYQYYSIRKATS